MASDDGRSDQLAPGWLAVALAFAASSYGVLSLGWFCNWDAHTMFAVLGASNVLSFATATYVGMFPVVAIPVALLTFAAVDRSTHLGAGRGIIRNSLLFAAAFVTPLILIGMWIVGALWYFARKDVKWIATAERRLGFRLEGGRSGFDGIFVSVILVVAFMGLSPMYAREAVTTVEGPLTAYVVSANPTWTVVVRADSTTVEYLHTDQVVSRALCPSPDAGWQGLSIAKMMRPAPVYAACD